MTEEQEYKLKTMAAEQQECGSPYGDNMGTQAAPKAPSLRDRISVQRFRAQGESRRADALMELEYLLDKHPEVARILDLLDFVKSERPL